MAPSTFDNPLQGTSFNDCVYKLQKDATEQFTTDPTAQSYNGWCAGTTEGLAEIGRDHFYLLPDTPFWINVKASPSAFSPWEIYIGARPEKEGGEVPPPDDGEVRKGLFKDNFYYRFGSGRCEFQSPRGLAEAWCKEQTDAYDKSQCEKDPIQTMTLNDPIPTLDGLRSTRIRRVRIDHVRIEATTDQFIDDVNGNPQGPYPSFEVSLFFEGKVPLLGNVRMPWSGNIVDRYQQGVQLEMAAALPHERRSLRTYLRAITERNKVGDALPQADLTTRRLDGLPLDGTRAPERPARRERDTTPMLEASPKITNANPTSPPTIPLQTRAWRLVE